MPSDRKKSGNPAKKVSTAAQWRKKTAQMELTLPSGEVCLVKRPGLPQLIAANVLPDMLSGIAQAAITQGKNGAAEKAAKDAQDKIDELVAQPGGLETMLGSFAQITSYCVIEPKCLYHRRIKDAGQIDQIQESYVPEWEDIPVEDRDTEVIYTDEVDLEDQMFIFNFVVGGSADLVEFRNGLNQSLGGVAAVPAITEDAI